MSVSIGLFRTKLDSPLCAKVAAHETLLQDGVIKLSGDALRALAPGRVTGIDIALDTHYRLVVRITLVAEFGFDFKTMAEKVQQAVHRGISEASDLQVRAIHVRIAGVQPQS